VHALLFEGEGLEASIERPPALTGTLVGGGLAAASLGLALAVALQASRWPISLEAFLGYAAAAALAAVAALFAFWAYASYTLRYVLAPQGLAVRFGLTWHVVPWPSIREVAKGRPELRLDGLRWWGLCVGRAEDEGRRPLLAFATRCSPERLVLVRAARATYLLSPRDPERFLAEVARFLQRRSRAGQPAREHLRRPWLAAHPIWGDRVAQGLLLLGAALSAATFAYVFAVYAGLPDAVSLRLSLQGEPELVPKREMLELPFTGLALLGLSTVAGLALHYRERAAAYLLFTGGALLQPLFLAAAALAVVGA
jgi:hypothetical protein